MTSKKYMYRKVLCCALVLFFLPSLWAQSAEELISEIYSNGDLSYTEASVYSIVKKLRIEAEQARKCGNFEKARACLKIVEELFACVPTELKKEIEEEEKPGRILYIVSNIVCALALCLSFGLLSFILYDMSTSKK